MALVDVPPEQLALLLETGYLYLEMHKHREAEDVFTGVAALVPDSEVPLLCLGNLHFSQGRYERALKFHREAVQKNPESALALAHTGETLLFLKRRDEARDALQRAIELDPEGDAGAFAHSLLDGAAAGLV